MRNIAESEPYLYLTTIGRKSGLLREIEIWFTLHSNHFYVIAEYPTSHWVQNIRSQADVQVRLAGRQLAAHARILSPETDAELIRNVQNRSREKYGWGDGLVVELIPAA